MNEINPKNIENPLVSVRVLTYNSSKTILETLESVKAQTYKNIELIISDDCSTDETISVCEKWLQENKNKFIKTQLLTVEINTGISANINRSINAATGEWVKGIGGDDLLLPTCVEDNINFIKTQTHTDLLCSKLQRFKVNKNGKKDIIIVSPDGESGELMSRFNLMTSHEQFISLLRDGNPIQAPTLFARREFLINNPYNPKYKYQEDYPQWINVTYKGTKIYFLDKITVMYRIGESLSNRSTDYHSRNYLQTRSLFFWNECLDYYRKEKLEQSYDSYRKILLLFELTEAFTQNHKSKLNSIKRRIIIFLIKYAKYELY